MGHCSSGVRVLVLVSETVRELVSDVLCVEGVWVEGLVSEWVGGNVESSNVVAGVSVVVGV